MSVGGGHGAWAPFWLGVVGVAVVGVVVVGVVEPPPETPTKIRTLLPLGRWVPPLGLWRRTVPTSADSPVTTEETEELRPARSRASSAASSVRPTTVGTATFLAFGASATTRLIFVLERTSLAALGSWLRTFPGDWLEDGWRVTVPLARPASSIADCAEERLSPVTSGTVISAGPLETSTVTVLPCRSTVPAGGSVPITIPAGTVALEVLCTSGTKPAPCRRSLASVACSPWTSGRATLAGPPETTILTVEPLLSELPAGGDWVTTRPVATRTLAASVGFACSPARRRA